MDKANIQDYILEKISDRLKLFDISRREAGRDFDLVKSGLIDSMSFVDMVAALEEKYSIEIDFETAAASDDFTRIGGLVDLVYDAINAK